jgi:hypothetical protein
MIVSCVSFIHVVAIHPFHFEIQQISPQLICTLLGDTRSTWGRRDAEAAWMRHVDIKFTVLELLPNFPDRFC